LEAAVAGINKLAAMLKLSDVENKIEK